MNKYLADKLTEKLYTANVITEKQREVYHYGIYSFLLWSENYLASFLIMCALHMFVEYVIFILIFSSLRSLAGGIHLKSAFSCFVFSTLLILVCCTELKYLYPLCSPLTAGIILLFSVLLFFLRPQDTPEKRLNETRRKKITKKYRRILIVYDMILCVYLLIYMIAAQSGTGAFLVESKIVAKIMVAIGSTYIITFLSLFLQYIKNKKQVF